MANDQLKVIVEEINKRLKNKNYNLISFDSLTPEQLLQVLTDILGEIDESNKVDIRQEDLEDTTFRILDMLRILKYKPVSGITPVAFRQGIVQGDKRIIHPVLEWLLTNMDEVKKRAYLAQFLVKIEIPPDILGDPDIAYLYEQYENKIEEFKNAHKENELLKGSSSSVAELRSDILAMEQEKEIVLKRIDKLQRRIESVADKDALLEAAKNLRQEKDRERELSAQEDQQRSLLMVNDQKLRRLQLQLKELKQASAGATPQGILSRLEEEASVNTYIAKQKLPHEIQVRQNEVEILETVLSEPVISHNEIEDLNNKIQEISNEINQMVERHLATQNPGEDKNAPFRQQGAIIARKKENKAEQLGEIRNQYQSIEDELEEKQNQLKEVAGDTILRGEEFKRYVNKLRGRSSVYKRNRSELAALKAEAGILTRTLEILTSRDQTVLQALAEEESQHGVSGYRETKEVLEKVSGEKADYDNTKGRTLDEMSTLVLQLSRRIASKKTHLAPLISELRPLREEFREVSDEYEQKKRVYDATTAGLENSTAKLLEEVDKMREEIIEAEKKITELEKENTKAEEDLIKVADEMKIYVSGNTEFRKQSLRDQLNQKINEQDKIGKQLKEEQRLVKETLAKKALQVEYWKNLAELMECKIQCFEEAKRRSGVVRREKGAETLILPQ